MFKENQWVEYKGNPAFIVIQRNNYRYIRVYDKTTTKNKSFSVPISELTELTFPTFELGKPYYTKGQIMVISKQTVS